MKQTDLSHLELEKIINSKLLFRYGSTFLENEDVQQIYNLSIVLFANALEIVLFSLAKQTYKVDKSMERVSEILKLFKKEEQLTPFPLNEIKQVLDARNDIYHKAEYRTLEVCKQLKETTLANLRHISKYLDLEFDDISILDTISDNSIREPLKIAEKYLNEGNYKSSIRNTCIAFAQFESRISDRSYWQVTRAFSNTWKNNKISWDKVQRRLVAENNTYDPNLILVSNHIEEKVNEKFEDFSKKTYFLLLLNKHFEDYIYFVAIRPMYHIILDKSVVFKEKEFVEREFTKEEAEFCFNFVSEVVLEIEPKLKPVEVRTMDRKVVRTII